MDKILEAIQKGIQMGLEIQDDGLDQPLFKGSQITSDYHTDRANQIRWIKENFIDLGLPSGTLWCKWNIGATNGDTAESWYGNYYAWGEVKPKETYTLSNYKHYSTRLTKYNGEDGKTTLDPEDDVVKTTLGDDFRMPTKEDFVELSALPNKWVKDYNGIKGLDGCVFTGNNGNKLFIPGASCCIGSSINYIGTYCYLWSSSIYDRRPIHAYDLYLYPGNPWALGYDNRYFGQSVRAVI